MGPAAELVLTEAGFRLGIGFGGASHLARGGNAL